MDRLLAYSELKELKAKAELFHLTDLSDRLFYIVSGSIMLLKNESTTKEFIVDYHSSGDFFGEQGLFEKNISQRGLNAIARVNCVVAEIRYERFMDLSKIYPNLMNELNSQMVSRLRRMTQRTYELATLDAEAKVNNCLKELCRLPEAIQLEGGVQIKISCLEISKMVGCTRECVGRMVQMLIRKGRIYRKGHTFVVYDQVKVACQVRPPFI